MAKFRWTIVGLKDFVFASEKLLALCRLRLFKSRAVVSRINSTNPTFDLRRFSGYRLTMPPEVYLTFVFALRRELLALMG